MQKGNKEKNTKLKPGTQKTSKTSLNLRTSKKRGTRNFNNNQKFLDDYYKNMFEIY